MDKDKKRQELKYTLRNWVYKQAKAKAEQDKTTEREQRAAIVNQLAEAVNRHPNHIRRCWAYKLNSTNEVSMDMLAAWARILGIGVADLLHKDLRSALYAASNTSRL